MSVNRNDINVLNQLVHYGKISNLILSIVILVANIAVIITYITLGRMRKKITNFTLCSQAVIDVFIGITALMNVIPEYEPSLIFNARYNLAVSSLFDYTVFLALGSLLLSSVERYIAMKNPLYHRRVVTRRRMLTWTLLIWVLSFIPSVYYICKVNKKYLTHSKRFLVLYRTICMSIVIIGIGLVILYLLLTLKTIKLAIKEKISLANRTITIDRIHNKRHLQLLMAEHRKESKVIKTFLTMVSVYAISFLPMAIIHLTHDHLDIIGTVASDILTTQLYISSALFNPMFTVTRKDDYKKVIFKFFCRHKQRCEIQLSGRNTEVTITKNSDILTIE